jgi:hypothetical protein
MFFVPIPLFRFLPDPIQHPNARTQFRCGNLVEQFVPKLEGRGVDLRDHALRSPAKVHCLATAIVGRAFADHPPFVFQPMQQRNQRRLFNAKARGDFGLGQRVLGDRQMQ